MIYVITHKKIDINIPDGYRKLLVGAFENTEVIENYTLDSSGDNISAKNNSYCELTGLYWIWKNSEYDVVGLVHYRRFFVNLKPCIQFRGRYFCMGSPTKSYHILTQNEIDKLLTNTEIIVKQSEYRKRTNKYYFEKNLGEDLWKQLENGVKLFEPDYYYELNQMAEAHQHINCNMFIGSKSIVDKYCEWLFPLLEKIDNEHKEDTGCLYHSREVGYLAEILFGVWLNKNNVNYKVCPVINIGDNQAVNGIMPVYFFPIFIFNWINTKIKSLVLKMKTKSQY